VSELRHRTRRALLLRSLIRAAIKRSANEHSNSSHEHTLDDSVHLLASPTVLVMPHTSHPLSDNRHFFIPLYRLLVRISILQINTISLYSPPWLMQRQFLIPNSFEHFSFLIPFFTTCTVSISGLVRVIIPLSISRVALYEYNLLFSGIFFEYFTILDLKHCWHLFYYLSN
jgi:hypothetical protein